MAALTPAVTEEGNGNRHNKCGSIGRDRHEWCTNRTITHAADDGGCKVGQAEKDISGEEEYDGQNENLVK